MIRKAKLEDLDEIYSIVKEAVRLMNEQGNFQWDENYPLPEHFEKDINEDTLYVKLIDNEIAGIVCLTYHEDDYYKNVNWSKDSKAINIHRLVVSVKYRGKGVAKSLFKHSEKVAIDSNTFYIKGDTHYVNNVVNSLFINNNYTYVGDMNIPNVEGTFKCYDKILSK